jgi:hypothetical protein
MGNRGFYGFSRRDILIPVGLNPMEIATLQQWLRSDSIVGKNDGDTLAQWDDSSGNANPATQTTEANKPLYKINRLNGLPAIYFSDNTKWMYAGYNPILPFTLFLVYVRRNGGNRIIQGSNNWLVGPYAAFGYAHSVYNNDWVGTGGTLVSTNQAIYSTLTEQTGLSIKRCNGATIGTNAQSGIPGTLYMGGQGAYAGEGAVCDIVEMLIYSSILSSPNIDNVELYLKNKYAL